MSPADAARIAAKVIEFAPDVFEAVEGFVDGLKADDATKARRQAGVAVARAHKRAVEAALNKGLGSG